MNSKTFYALQRVADNSWLDSYVSKRKNPIKLNPVLIANKKRAIDLLTVYAVNLPKIGEIRIREIEVTKTVKLFEEEIDIADRHDFITNLRNAIACHPYKMGTSEMHYIIQNFVILHEKYRTFRYAVVPERDFNWNKFDFKPVKKMAKFFYKADSFLVKGDSDLVALRLHEFKPAFVYDIQERKVIL